MRPLARRCALALLVAVLSSLSAVPSFRPADLHAQSADRFTIAAGPAFALEDGPPSLGGHLRGSMALGTIPRPLNLVADAYVSYLPFGGLADASGSLDVNEVQVGAGLSGVVTLFPGRSVSPYLLVGGVVRWSSVAASFTPAAGSPLAPERASDDATQGDILLGIGTHVLQGGRRWSIEARLYGGSTINMPVTIGLTF